MREANGGKPVDIVLEMTGGTVFGLAHCMARPQVLDAAMGELLPMVAGGSLEPIVGARYPLADARDAHQDLLARRTTGNLVLDPKA